MLTALKATIWGLGALALSGCTMEAAATDDSGEPIASASQMLADMPWNAAGGVAAFGRGMSVNVNDVTYLWSSLASSQNPLLGYFCTGDIGTPCKNVQFYQTPFAPSKLRGAAISKTNGLVYSYFDGVVCEGTASNLGSRRILPFTVPAGLVMNQLVEVEQSTGGTWHYWWKKPDGVMVHTTSRSATDGGTVRSANVPYVPFPWVINGVVIDRGDPNLVWTYYSANNGANVILNASDNASNLHQW